MLRTGVLPVVMQPWQDVEARLRPFVARRVHADDIDDVLQDVYVRMQRGIGQLRDDARLTPWLFQVARSAVADHLRTRQRHPLPDDPSPPEAAAAAGDDTDHGHLLAGCIAAFVARLHSPYREAITLVELEGMTISEAAGMVGISVSGMKSRVRRGRAQLRELLEACCQIALDVRGRVIDVTPHVQSPCCPR